MGDAVLLSEPQPLRSVFPELIEPLKLALRECDEIEGETLGLDATVDELEVFGFCGCGDEFCGSFYTVQPPEDDGGWLADAKILGPLPGTITAIDVLDGRIAQVEITGAVGDFKSRYDLAIKAAK
jgi:hypothetical protein